jgi:hypothetical protein
MNGGVYGMGKEVIVVANVDENGGDRDLQEAVGAVIVKLGELGGSDCGVMEGCGGKLSGGSRLII